MEALGAELGVDLWIKRDDQSGVLYGGNKVRKLELLLGDALARGRDRVLTFGAYGSHHCLATATYARSLGLDVRLALTPQPLTEHVLDDLILSHATGASLTRVPRLLSFADPVWRRQSLPGEVIPLGGSSVLGTVGYVEAALELAEQIAAGELPKPDRIFVAAGTCGTVAGLALGLELAGLDCTVVAVRVVPSATTNLFRIRRLREGAACLLHAAGVSTATPRATVRVELDPKELGPGYGVETPAARAAMQRFRAHGIELETTYTGKTAAALLRRAGARGDRVLYWNTFSSVDLSARLAAAEPGNLPASFHPVLRAGGRLS
jgi:D-cysteine desulfhydrase